MNSLRIHESDVKSVIDLIHSGVSPETCVPAEWKLESNRDHVDSVYNDVCMMLWLQMGDTALNRSGYTNSLSSFWDEIIGRKEDKNKISEVEHWDEAWYF
tara:strand:- start:13 stop:312 length:300 start_codon:yes stop_codon:yes gene_type:complete